MTRYINNLTEWNTKELTNLLLGGYQSRDRALAVGDAEMSSLTDNQIMFIESLIKQRGGKLPTYEEIFGIVIGKNQYLCYQTIQSYQEDPSRFKDKELNEMFLSSTTVYKNPQLHDQKLCSFCGSCCNISYAQSEINLFSKDEILGLNA